MENFFLIAIIHFINIKVLNGIRFLDELPFWQMALIVFGAFFVIMGILYFLIKIFCKVELSWEGVSMANELNAAVYGLIIALVLVALYREGKKTEDDVSNEATKLLFVLRDAEAIDNSAEIRTALKSYTDIVINQQWGLMCEGRLKEAKALTKKTIDPLYAAVQHSQPIGFVQTSFYSALPNLLHSLNDAQQIRLDMSKPFLAIQFWRIINWMTLLVLLFLVYANFWRGSLFPTVITGLNVALAFLLLIAFHYPYLGPSLVSNDPLVQLQNQFFSNTPPSEFLSINSQPHLMTHMSLFDSFNETIIKTIFWLSGTPFLNMIFILFAGTFFILAVLLFLINRFRKTHKIQEGASMANTINASIYGLILAFFVVTLFETNQTAKENITQEAQCLTAIAKNTEFLDNAPQIHQALKEYIKLIVEDQWPLLCSRKMHQVLESSMTSLEPLYKAIREAHPNGIVQERFYAELPTLLHHLQQAQRKRIMDADLHLPIQFWRVIVVMTFLTLAFLVYTNPWKGFSTLIPILIPSIVIVFCLGLLITFHYPLIGPFKISPEEYLHIDLGEPHEMK